MTTPRAVLSDNQPLPGKTAGARPRGLAPKEHGAWGQLFAPLAVALGLGRPGFVAWGLAIAVVAVFMAHEPLLVVLGQRGTRAARETSVPAKRRLAMMLGAALVFGCVALAGGSWVVRSAAGVSVALLLVAVFGFLVRGQERSTFGELWIASTLPAASVPVCLAAGVSLQGALSVWLSFSLAFGAGIFGVRGIIKDFRENNARAGWVGLLLLLTPTVVLGYYRLHAGAAALFFWIIVATCRAWRPSPKSLKRLGWTLVGASVVQALWLIVAFRWGG